MTPDGRERADGHGALTHAIASPRQGARLLAWFRGLGLDLHDAEDCAQDTLLRLHRWGDRYRSRAPLGAFLLTVARSVHADWCRRRRVRRGMVHDLEAAAGLAAAPQATSELLDLRGALERLPAKLAEVVALTVIGGCSYQQAAERLSIPLGTVKSRMYLAVRRLRRELGP